MPSAPILRSVMKSGHLRPARPISTGVYSKQVSSVEGNLISIAERNTLVMSLMRNTVLQNRVIYQKVEFVHS